MIVDAGPLIAVLVRTDPDHDLCVECTKQIAPSLITTWPALTEASHILGARSGFAAQQALLQLIGRGAVEVDADGSPARMLELMRKYRDVPMDLADASLVELAERRRDMNIFTMDSDFEVYRVGRKAFKLWPR